MALSFYASWEMDFLNPVLTPVYVDSQSEVADALVGFFDPVHVPIDSLFDTQSNDNFLDCCTCPKDVYRLNSTVAFEADSYRIVPPPKKRGGGCVSAQSVAARQRRRRISEKTQELGRLVPGASKMNTAEMLQAAFKYVKFLQAQVGILGLMDSFQGSKDFAGVDEKLQVLLTSPTIQEKLCSEGKCIVSTQVVNALAGETGTETKLSRQLIS